MKKRILALALAAILIFSCIGTSVFAGGGEETNSLAEYAEGTGYVAFGDSITRGYGASDQWDSEGYRLDKVPENAAAYTNIKYLNDLDATTKAAELYQIEEKNKGSVFCRNVTDSYTKQIATELGCYTPDNMTIKDANYWPIAQDAFTTDMIVDLLGIENDFVDSDYFDAHKSMSRRYETDLYYFGSDYSFTIDGKGTYGGTAAAVDIRTLVDEAGLITINLGMGEILNRARTLATDKYDLATETAECAKELVTRMYEGYNNMVDQYPLLLNYIQNHSEATVILIGAYNPFYGITLTDETLIPIGNALSALTMQMNQQYKKWADEYGFTFLDISNVETGGVANDVDFISLFSSDAREQGIATHPTTEGYTQIKRMVINVLKEKNKEPKENVENIVVDLGKYSTVSYVLVNGILVDPSQYTLENYKLTVKCNNKYAKSLTVAVVDSSKKKISLQAYQLTYDKGYQAYRCYQSNDVVKTVSKPVSLLKKAGSWFVGLFK